MKKYTPAFAIFLAGTCTMIFEISGSRLMGPYFGTSIFVWTSIIGTIMAGLSLGYWLGGIVSLRRSDGIVFGWILLLAGIFILITVVGHDYVLRRIIKYLPEFRIKTLIAAVSLFGAASLFLGMILPYGAKLVTDNVLTSGASVGTLYALSTAGSIAGTFLAGFILLPEFGFVKVILTSAGCLLLMGLIVLIPLKKPLPLMASGLSLIALLLFWYRAGHKTTEYVDIDTQYNRVIVYETTDTKTGRPLRILQINDEKSSAMFTDKDDDLAFEVLKYYRLAEHFNPGFKNSLMIGGSGYAFPKDYLRRNPEATIDVVEIDPGLTDIAHKYFNLPEDSRLKIFHEDGRTYINKCKKKYDVVFMDAYKSMLTVPYQLTTHEAISRISDILKDDGAVYANIISTLNDKNNFFLRSEIATYKSFFPKVLIFAVQYPHPDENEKNYFQNFLLVGLKSAKHASLIEPNPELAFYLSRQYTGNLSYEGDILTDEYAPVEYFADKAMR